MSEKAASRLPRLTPEQRRAAAGQFERANQVLAKGDFDYALPLLLNCCVIDPGNAVYRQVLRQAAKNKYGNNQRGQKLAGLTNLRDKFSLRKAQLAGDHCRVLECGEKVLLRNPWDVSAQFAMAGAFQELELNDLAIWTLEQARQIDGNHVQINRFLARLYEKRGNFNQAIALWQAGAQGRSHGPGSLEQGQGHRRQRDDREGTLSAGDPGRSAVADGSAARARDGSCAHTAHRRGHGGRDARGRVGASGLGGPGYTAACIQAAGGVQAGAGICAGICA